MIGWVFIGALFGALGMYFICQHESKRRAVAKAMERHGYVKLGRNWHYLGDEYIAPEHQKARTAQDDEAGLKAFDETMAGLAETGRHLRANGVTAQEFSSWFQK